MEDRNAPVTKSDIAQLSEKFEQLRSESDKKFEQLRSESDKKFEQLRSESDKRFEQLRSESKENFEQLRSEVNHGYNDIVERIHDSQTELLRAFYGYAQGNNKRVAELEGNEGAFRSRLATIEDRILEVERRLNTPPAA